MVSAIPLVKPTTIGYGMKWNMVPMRQSPITIRMIPAIIVATVSPAIPYCPTMPATMTMNAPVGPPIKKREPPKTETRNPATIAVMSPCWGVTPLAIPNAIASGRAMIPTIIPAMRSETNLSLLYRPFWKRWKNLGRNTLVYFI